MKNNLKVFLLGLILFACQQSAFSQDKMILRFKKDTLVVKVMEVGIDEVKYKLWPVSPTAAVIVESKEKIRRIIFENGTVMKFAADEFTDATNYSDQRKIVVKVDMLAITRKVLFVSYEQSIKPGVSVECGIGVINQNSYSGELWDFQEAHGIFARIGYKFINQPDFHIKGMRYTHILKGGYIKPELMFLSQKTSNTYVDYVYPSYTAVTFKSELRTSGYAGFLNFGKQWIMDDIFAVDFYVGLGIGIKNSYYTETNTNTNSSTKNDPTRIDLSQTAAYGFAVCTFTNHQVGLTTQAGLKVGMLIGAKKKQN